MKKNKPFRELFYCSLKKTLKIMRNALILLFIGVLQAHAIDTYSQKTRLSLDFSDTELTKVLDKIEVESEFFFLYNEKLLDIDRKVSITENDQLINVILDDLFTGTDVRYTIIDQKIILAPEYLTEKSEIQQRSISGTVVDSKGEPLPGVTVRVKGTSIGTQTDIDGKFKLSNLSESSILMFSFVGMQTQEIEITGKELVNVTLIGEDVGLDEVVVIGYGTVKKQNITGTISQIKADALENRALASLGEGFAGKMAGVLAQQTTGKPGSELFIRIRGTSTLNAGTAPLYVIDGVPAADIQDINPSDIKSVEVLKDAASAAIYGARGGNGVVLVTTKQGIKGKPTFDLDVSYGLQRVDKKVPVFNRNEYIAYLSWARNVNYIRSGGSMNDPMGSRPIGYQIPNEWLDPESMPDTDWQDAIYRIAPMADYQLSASGGGDIGSFMISGSYMNQYGIMECTGYKRTTFRVNTTLNVGQHLKLGMNISPSYSISNNPDSEGKETVSHHAIQMPAIVPLNSMTEELGYTAGVSLLPNPLIRLQTVKQETRYNKLQTNVWGELEITKSLSFRSQYGYNTSESKSTYFRPSNVNLGNATGGSSAVIDYYIWSLQNTITYAPKISSLFDMSLLLGQSIEGSKNYYVAAGKSGYPNDLIYTMNVASTATNANSSESENSMLSYFGRLNFNMKDKYLLTINGRYDASSRFGPDTRWGWFPSASLGWKINKEEFMKNIPWLDLLKIRLSIGKAGNNSIGDYEPIALLKLSNYSLNGSVVNGLAPSTLGNPDLGWETRLSRSVGLDFGAFKNRIQANLDYYNDLTTDMLFSVNVPYMSGYGSVRENIGKIQNRGLEFELTTSNIESPFKWTSSFNISSNINKIKALGLDDAPIITSMNSYICFIQKVGEAVGSFYMYKTDGLLLEDDFDETGKAIVPIATGQEIGNIKIVDTNNDGVIDANDLTICGKNQPDFLWGITNNFSYKNFSLSAFFQGAQGGKVFMLGLRQIGYLKKYLRSYKQIQPNGENPIPDYLGVDMSWDGETEGGVGANPRYSDRWLDDASYTRLKNITIGYTLPENLSRRIGIQSARIYVMGDNVFTWSKYLFASPETNMYGNQTTQMGVDYGTYPISRRYSLGINLTF
ncbi:MAG: TonB-dependent receptor [Bacteroidia bacterium]|nr:TonB-dependent receptor [Bacteroidia bacterium]